MRTPSERRMRAATIAAGGLAGLVIAGGLALISTLAPVVAGEEPLTALLKTGEYIVPRAPIEDDTFFKPDWTLEASVSTEIIKEEVVRKIGFGRTEFVRVVTTSSGTYSSDGIASPHIRYPGLHDTRIAASREGYGLLGIWNGHEWVVLNGLDAGSFATVIPFEDGRIIIHEGGACTFVGDSVYC